MNEITTPPKTNTKPCATCGVMIECPPLELFGRPIFTDSKVICDACGDLQSKTDMVDRKAAAVARRVLKWQEKCPPLYRNSMIGKIPSHFRSKIETWKFSPTGIGFVGAAGKCKTRSAFLLLEKYFMDGHECEAVSSTKLAKLTADQFSDSETIKYRALDRIDKFKFVDIFFIDDLGKAKSTERYEMELFDILEHRTSHLLPTIWTANTSGDDLLSMMSKDRGEPIIRRLAEFSEVITA